MLSFPDLKQILAILSLYVAAISFTGCDIINPSEKIPAYLHIDSFTLKGSYDSFGTLSHAITDVWVIIDNEFIGAYELPADIPVLKEGKKSMVLKAGIKENGITNTRLPYPFYDGYFSTVELKSS